MSERMVSAKGR